MKVYLALFSTLREYLNPKPAIGESLEVEIEKGTTIGELANQFLPRLSEIGIIMVNGIHQTLEYEIQDENIRVSIFPLSGGG